MVEYEFRLYANVHIAIYRAIGDKDYVTGCTICNVNRANGE